LIDCGSDVLLTGNEQGLGKNISFNLIKSL
jgi:hypothetical protein